MHHLTSEQIAAEIYKAGGNLSQAAKRLGVHRSTLYRTTHSAELQKARAKHTERLIDDAERVLFEAVRRGDVSAAKFILSTLGKSRGYTRHSPANPQYLHAVHTQNQQNGEGFTKSELEEL